MNLFELQLQVKEWADKNFPNNPPDSPFMGIVEEIGELAAAMIARRAAVEELEDPESSSEAERDAIGDITIYLTDYCNKRGVWVSYLHDAWFRGSGFKYPSQIQDWCAENDDSDGGNNPFFMLVLHLGRLAHARLKMKQGIRGSAKEHEESERDALACIICQLCRICNRRSWSYTDIIYETWGTVKQRDWTKNRLNGAAPAEVVRSTNPYESN